MFNVLPGSEEYYRKKNAPPGLGEAFLSEDCYSLFNQLHLLRLIHFI
jgi:hypothetical protein